MKSVTERVYLTDFILACFAYFLFVGHDSIAKHLAETYAPIQIIFVNSWFAIIPVLLYTQTLHGWKKLKKANLKVHFFRSLSMALAIFFCITGFYHLPMVTMYSIVFLIPLLITIGSVLFLGEVVRWKRFTAIILGFIGTIISVNPFGAELNNYVFLALGTPIFASTSYLIVRKYGGKENLFSFLVYGKILMIIFTGIVAVFYFKPLSLNDLMLNGCAGFMRGVAMIFVINAARHLPGAIFGSITYIQIFAGILVGYFVFSEIPTINNYVGNIIIVGAGIYIVLREMQLKKNIVSSTARHPTIPLKKSN